MTEKLRQMAGGVNYFELFGLPQKIEQEPQALMDAYFKLQSAMHPDRFTNKAHEELETAMVNSAVINNAYRILSNKFECAQYLIAMHTSSDKKVPTEFMAASLDLHERKLEGEDIVPEVKAMEASLWGDLETSLEVAEWDKAAEFLAKLKIISRFL